MHTAVAFRPITSQDEEFLYRVYASSREEELAQVAWGASEKEAFLRMQFSLQHKYYREVFSAASFLIIELERLPIGRLYIDRTTDEIHIIDIALLPEHRGRGIGTSLLKAILAEAAANNLPATIYVERFNRAQNLYRRLGFATVSESEVYLLMECKPAQK
jgi:ribosomal protein S18 acetylase RimI-like enzyme